MRSALRKLSELCLKRSRIKLYKKVLEEELSYKPQLLVEILPLATKISRVGVLVMMMSMAKM